MKKGLAKAAVLAAVFIISLVIFGSFMNKDQLDLTTEMAEATLPIVVLYDDEQQINELHGHTIEMDAVGMRDTITPLSSNREIPLQVRTYGSEVDSISYEIRSIDGERLVSDGEITSFQEEDGQIRTSIPVQSLLEQSREYILTLKLKNGEDIYFYYTRIADAQDCHVAESVKFAQQVNDLTFSETPDALSTYWEPNASGDNSSLHKVTINSSLMQANWADFECTRLTTPIPSVKEMNSSYNVIVLDYVVTASGSDEGLEYYNVEECYRIRYTTERMYLLNFERTMDQIFNGENDFLYENYLQLGIRAKEVTYRQNETGTVTCFVQEGDLWSYNQDTNRLAQVFSFRGHEGIDLRENYMQHDIRILDVDEAGDIHYVVYGYMNRGDHEGEVGISFLHYNSLTNTNEEDLFVAFDRSYEVLKAELEKLLYQNASGGIYLLSNGTVYHIDLETMEVKTVAEELADGSFAASVSNRYLAWISDDASQEITVMDLESGRTKQIRAKKGKTLRVLGFLEEDFVYGIAADKHRITGAAGIWKSPMHALRITDAANAQVIKEYRKKGYFIDDVEFNGGVLIIKRLRATENGYVHAQQDSIVNRNQEDEEDIIHVTVTDGKQTQVQLTLAEQESGKMPVYIAAKQVIDPEEQEIALKTGHTQQNYLVYAWGRVKMETTDIAQAICCADENMGVVVDARQDYIWKRARKSIQQPLDVMPSEADAAGTAIAKCVSAMLKSENVEVSAAELLERGDTLQEILDSLLAERKVIDIAGCSLSQVLYYVNCGTPVLAVTGAHQAVLIVGYDALNVWVYDPQAGGVSKQVLKEVEERISAAGGAYVVIR